MELKPAPCFGVSGRATVEIARDNRRSLLANIEAELQNSEVYTKVLASLKTMLGEAATKAEILLETVGKEAIELAMKKFAKKYLAQKQAVCKTTMTSKSSNTEKDTSVENSAIAPQSDRALTKQLPASLPAAPIDSVTSAKHLTPADNNTIKLASTSQPPIATSSALTHSGSAEINKVDLKKGSSGKPPKKNKKKKLSKAELALQEISEKRRAFLQQIGQELRKARIMRCLSLKQVHSQTLVPLQHLDAIEKGNIEQLPEDIYIRGFIHRLGDALGLDGASMAAALPALDPLQGVIPSWSRADLNSGGVYLHPVHLYLGYTALMAGAVGGLTWLTQQPMPGANLMPELPGSSSQETIAGSNSEAFFASSGKKRTRYAEALATPGLKFTEAGVVVGSDIAPPEVMN